MNSISNAFSEVVGNLTTESTKGTEKDLKRCLDELEFKSLERACRVNSRTLYSVFSVPSVVNKYQNKLNLKTLERARRATPRTLDSVFSVPSVVNICQNKLNLKSPKRARRATPRHSLLRALRALRGK